MSAANYVLHQQQRQHRSAISNVNRFSIHSVAVPSLWWDRTRTALGATTALRYVIPVSIHVYLTGVHR